MLNDSFLLYFVMYCPSSNLHGKVFYHVPISTTRLLNHNIFPTLLIILYIISVNSPIAFLIHVFKHNFYCTTYSPIRRTFEIVWRES